MDDQTKKLLAGDTWAINGDRIDLDDSSLSYPVQRSNGFQPAYSSDANPNREMFNQLLCETVAACKETLYGISPWDSEVTYPVGAFTNVNGVLYTAITENTGVNPLHPSQTAWANAGGRISNPITVPDAIVAANVFIDNTRADRFKVYWNPPDDGGATITQVRLRYSKQSDFSSGVSSISNYSAGDDVNISARDSDLYYIRLRFTNSRGHSAESASFKVRTNPLTPPAVTGIYASNGRANQTIDLAWAPVTPANGLTISKYRIEWKSGTEDFSSSANPARHKDVTGTSTAITGLTNGTTYTFRITTISNRSTQAVSTTTETIEAITAGGVPAKPVISAVSGNQSIIASATNVPNNNGKAITSYEWQYKLTTATDWTDATDTTVPIITISSIDPGAYNVRMRAVNSVGNGAWSASVNATATGATAPSGVVAAVSSGGPGRAIVSLGQDIDDGGAAITGYQWSYKTATASEWTSLTSSTNPTQTLTSLTNGVQYNFRVAATNSVGTTTSASVSSTIENPTAVLPTVAGGVFFDSIGLVSFGAINGTINSGGTSLSSIEFSARYRTRTSSDGTWSDWSDWSTRSQTNNSAMVLWDGGFDGFFTGVPTFAELNMAMRYRIQNSIGWSAWSEITTGTQYAST